MFYVCFKNLKTELNPRGIVEENGILRERPRATTFWQRVTIFVSCEMLLDIDRNKQSLSNKIHPRNTVQQNKLRGYVVKVQISHKNTNKST